MVKLFLQVTNTSEGYVLQDQNDQFRNERIQIADNVHNRNILKFVMKVLRFVTICVIKLVA